MKSIWKYYFTTIMAGILGSLLLAWALFFNGRYIKIGDTVIRAYCQTQLWTLVQAGATVAAVVVALYVPLTIEHRKRRKYFPVLSFEKIKPYRQDYKKKIRIPIGSGEYKGQTAEIEVDSTLLIYRLIIRNSGNEYASDVRALVTSIWEMQNNKWEVVEKITPIALNWMHNSEQKRDVSEGETAFLDVVQLVSTGSEMDHFLHFCWANGMVTSRQKFFGGFPVGMYKFKIDFYERHRQLDAAIVKVDFKENAPPEITITGDGNNI